MNYRGKDQEEIFEFDASTSVLEGSANLVGKSATAAAIVDPEVEIAISTNPIQTIDSFNYFQRATFTNITGSLSDPQQWSLASADEKLKHIESPWERYLRLQGELLSLQEDLNGFIVSEEQGKASIWSYLQSETQKMLLTNKSLQAHPAWQKLKPQEKSNDKHHAEAEILEQLKQQVASISSSSIAAVGSTQQTTRVGDGNNNAAYLASLEQRVHSLETLLGYTTNASDFLLAVNNPSNQNNNHNKVHQQSIYTTLQSLENQLQLLDAKTVDYLRSKLKLLKSELEILLAPVSSTTSIHNNNSLKIGPSSTNAASGSSSASGGSVISQEIKIFEAAKKIESLLEKVSMVEGIAEDLPRIVQRLKTLEGIHYQASLLPVQVQALEASSLHLEKEVKSNREVMQALTEELQENLKIMQENVKVIGEKIEEKASKK